MIGILLCQKLVSPNHPFPSSGDLPPRSIPLSMTVVGCPINFQLTAAIGDITPIVRFGGHITGGPVIRRQMRINNPSPFPIRIDWETFNVRPRDDQLLDMVVVMGQAFPLRDENGEEIVPEGGRARTGGGGFQAVSSGKTRKSAMTNRRSDAGSQFLPDVIEEDDDVVGGAVGGSGGADSPADERMGGMSGAWSRGASANPQQRRISGAASTPAGKRKREEDFISVVMKCHEGVRSNVPFDVYPKQLVIGGHASLFVQVRRDIL